MAIRADSPYCSPYEGSTQSERDTREQATKCQEHLNATGLNELEKQGGLLGDYLLLRTCSACLADELPPALELPVGKMNHDSYLPTNNRMEIADFFVSLVFELLLDPCRSTPDSSPASAIGAEPQMELLAEPWFSASPCSMYPILGAAVAHTCE